MLRRCLRQNYNRTLERVSKETEISAWLIDCQEVGYKGYDWLIVEKLLTYDQKNIKVKLVNRYSDVELAAMRQKNEERSTLKEARQIVEKGWNVEAAESELMQKAKKTKIPSPQTPATACITEA